jgi:hypothetical protein
MDDVARKALIKKFGDAKNFDSNYSEPNRLWFVEKLIRKLESEGLNDAAVEQKTGEVVQKATAVVKANRDFPLALTADGNGRFTARALRATRLHRVEILYGAIAFNRQFVEPQHLEYLIFTAKRRFHGFCRMYFWVNPNGPYFNYRSKCKEPNVNWRVNEDAGPFWERLSPTSSFTFKLKPQAGGAVEPVTALAKIFVKKPTICKSNLLDCSTVASLIFMESLREAKNPNGFLNKLASKGANYLLIHQLGFPPHANFYQDVSDEGVMEIVGAPAVDLQNCDHVYIFNHPLYKTFRPKGSWRGEHALVYTAGDRNHKSRKGYVFGGHGKDGTLFEFYDEFLSKLKSHLNIARQLMAGHLAFMRGGAPAIVPGTVVEAEHDVVIGGDPAARYRLLEYDKNVEAKDYTRIPTKTTKKPKRGTPAFVVVQSKTEHVFYLDQAGEPDEDVLLDRTVKKTIAEITATGKLEFPIKFRRLVPPVPGATPDSIYADYSWGVEYLDPSTGTAKMWSFHEVIGGVRVRRKELTHEDLFQSPFSLFTKKGADLKVSRPKVNFGAAHQSFLTTNGAF